MFVFVTSKVFFEVVAMLTDASPWITHFLAELSEACLWSAVAYTFRLSHPDVFAQVRSLALATFGVRARVRVRSSTTSLEGP